MLQPRDRLADRAAVAAAAELYDRDPVLWSEQQAELLRQVAAGKRPAGIDWADIVEEIESVGRSQVNAVESLLLQTLVHEFKIVFWPETPYVEGWRNESLLYQSQAAQQFTPSIGQKIDVPKLIYRAVRAVPPTIDGAGYHQQSLMAAFDEAHRQVRHWIGAPEGPVTIRLGSLGSAPPENDDLFRPYKP